jgi:hypothetical protein
MLAMSFQGSLVCITFIIHEDTRIILQAVHDVDVIPRLLAHLGTTERIFVSNSCSLPACTASSAMNINMGCLLWRTTASAEHAGAETAVSRYDIGLLYCYTAFPPMTDIVIDT